MIEILKALCMPVSVIFLVLAVGLCLCLLRLRERTRTHLTGRILLLVGVLCLYALSIWPVANALVYPLESRYPAVGAEAPKDVQAVVVLGGGVWQASRLRPRADLSGSSLARVVGGVNLLRNCNARYLILTGCSPVEGGTTVAEVMARTAFEMGVPHEKIVVEKRATNTFEHPARILEILPQIRQMKLAVVTSASHMPRSIAAFEKYFDRAKLVPAPVNWYYNDLARGPTAFIPSADALSVSTAACREYLGQLWYRIRSRPKVSQAPPAT